MNLQKTINRDGSVTWYLNEPKEAQTAPTLWEVLKGKILSFRVRITHIYNILTKIH